MEYRSDIDGLRAIAVMSVIAFHTGISALSGGYIGVDVFFVISGYLITTLIYKEIRADTFTFKNFYKRRAARLLPALTLTLLIVLIFGFVFYSNKAFDILGKELFYSSFGAANILFAQGINYFATDAAYQPLIHLWSLGVEEQFYIVWPLILLMVFRFSSKLIIPVTCVFFLVSLALSIIAVSEGLPRGYFLLHYRAFELLVGVITALLLQRTTRTTLSNFTKQVLTYIGLLLIVLPMILLDKQTNFPGINALWPCLGAALIIAFPNHGLVTRILSNKVFVFVGLVSYPLYLFHQPIISFFHFFNVQFSSTKLFLIVTVISLSASWITYKYVEIPIRKLAQSPMRTSSFVALAGLCATIPFLAIVGLVITKSSNLDARYTYFNPFALEVDQAHVATFRKNFERGYEVSTTAHSRALFVGDSTLQQYALPIKLALELDKEQIDTVTRGSCVLLKGTEFIDEISGISCNEIRDKLYKSKKTYDYVVISQGWDFSAYNSSVQNFSTNTSDYERWSKLLTTTVEHFLNFADKVIIIGAHLSVEGTHKVQPSIISSRESFLSNLKTLKVINHQRMEESRQFFAKYHKNENIMFLEPKRIFCTKKCVLSDDQWSYFYDDLHITSASTEFVKSRIIELMNIENEKRYE